MKTIVLAAGCFWGSQAYFRRLPGVIDTVVGYANGITPNPVYSDVKNGGTGYAEAVQVRYDPTVISIETLLRHYFRIIDPTTLNRQGPDIGDNYRTGIFYSDPAEVKIIEAALMAEQKKYDRPIVTQVLPLKNFYRAEEYHQDYLEKNPGGYCHVDLSLLNRPLP